MAQEVNRSQSTLRQFLADASHELRTPLTSIQGFSQAMVDGAVDEPTDLAESARIINEEAQRCVRSLDDLLYLSQIRNRSGQRAAGAAGAGQPSEHVRGALPAAGAGEGRAP